MQTDVWGSRHSGWRGVSNLSSSRPDVVWVLMKRGQEAVSRRKRGPGMIGSTHVCGPVSSIVPDVVHHGGQVLQTVRDVVRKEQDAHCLKAEIKESKTVSGFFL